MGAFYNEIEPYAAQWMRNLSAAGHIAEGVVDERSIVELQPGDLAGHRQVHLFAGLGAWSYALRLAGVSDDTEIWTGSCPCQPFSAAGKRGGFADERHLWPEFFRLIAAVRPRLVMGEQVASKDGLAWLDVVRADLEGAGYAFRAADLCAAGVGAPHIRQRLYWVAYANTPGCGVKRGSGLPAIGNAPQRDHANGCGAFGGVAYANDAGLEGWRKLAGRRAPQRASGARGVAGWSNAEWIRCLDGKRRPVEPGSFPLANGTPARVGPDGTSEAQSRTGMLKAYGNSIVAPLAAEFIKAAMSAICDSVRE